MRALLALALGLGPNASQPVLKPYDLGLPCWRIPSAVRVGRRILLLAEGRTTKGDGCFDGEASRDGVYIRAVYATHSDDEGATWSPLQLVGGNQTVAGRAADPQAVFDPETGTVVLQYRMRDGESTWQRTSRDGITWTPAVCLDAFFGRYAGFSAPGVGIAVGGRLLFAVYGTVDGADGTGWATVVYSDDHGATYHVASVDGGDHNSSFTGVDESQVVALGDGRLLLSMRISGGGTPRRAAVSADNGATWTDHGTGPTALPAGAKLPENTEGCQASLLRAGPSVYYSQPLAADGGRSHMTVLRSDDHAQSWPKGQVVYAGPSAYSCLVAGAAGAQPGLFYERGWDGCGESCSIFYTQVPDLPPYQPPHHQVVV